MFKKLFSEILFIYERAFKTLSEFDIFFIELREIFFRHMCGCNVFSLPQGIIMSFSEIVQFLSKGLIFNL